MKEKYECRVCGKDYRCRLITHFPPDEDMKGEDPTFQCPYGLGRSDPVWGMIDKSVWRLVQ